ncbi:hypothetical protein LTR94_025639 [Friedmanniomyces endolithicus]|nr:hypothetical protein LTR94_025639 [Friedmanniomyces endolithicus]
MTSGGMSRSFQMWMQTLILSLLGLQPSVGLVSYEEAVRCAGLTQAASELEGGETSRGKSLYDAALYWTLAAMQAGTAAGRAAQASEADQNRARIEAVRQLSADAPAARTALGRCLEKTPELD